MYIRRAIPPVEQRRIHALGIAFGERIFRLGQSADVNAADGAGLIQYALRHRQWRHDLIVLHTSCGKNPSYSITLTTNFNLISGML